MPQTQQLPACPHCGYWLKSLPGQVCPECGHRIDWELAWQRERDPTSVRAAKWAALGAASGCISAAISSLGPVLFVPGVVFGVLMAWHLRCVNGPEFTTPLLGILYSTFAYLGALVVLSYASSSGDFLWEVVSMGAAGAMGAVLLDLMIRTLELPNMPWRRTAVSCIAGGLATAIATVSRSALDPFVGSALHWIWFFAIFIAWQAAIAAVFGAFRQEPRPGA